MEQPDRPSEGSVTLPRVCERSLENAVQWPERRPVSGEEEWAPDRATRPDCLSGEGQYPLSNVAWRDRVASRACISRARCPAARGSGQTRFCSLHSAGCRLQRERCGCGSGRFRPRWLRQGRPRLWRRLDERDDLVRVGNHRAVVGWDFNGGCTHALGELALGVGRDRLVAGGDQVPGRSDFHAGTPITSPSVERPKAVARRASPLPTGSMSPAK